MPRGRPKLTDLDTRGTDAVKKEPHDIEPFILALWEEVPPRPYWAAADRQKWHEMLKQYFDMIYKEPEPPAA